MLSVCYALNLVKEPICVIAVTAVDGHRRWDSQERFDGLKIGRKVGFLMIASLNVNVTPDVSLPGNDVLGCSVAFIWCCVCGAQSAINVPSFASVSCSQLQTYWDEGFHFRREKENNPVNRAFFRPKVTVSFIRTVQEERVEKTMSVLSSTFGTSFDAKSLLKTSDNAFVSSDSPTNLWLRSRAILKLWPSECQTGNMFEFLLMLVTGYVIVPPPAFERNSVD